MSYIAGFSSEDFEACAQRAELVRLADTSVPVLHLDDLITAKAALDRAKDKEDLRRLERIREMKKKDG